MIKNNSLYILLNILIFFLILFSPFFRIDGGVSDDTYNYIKVALAIPHLKTSVFPIGYPLTIKLINVIVNDFYFTTRIIAIFGYLFIILFSYFKRFYFKETSLLMGMKIFIIFMFSYSETLFLPLFYLLIFLIHRFFSSEKYNRSLIIQISFVLILLFIIRYSSLFILGGFILMVVLELLKKKKNSMLIKSLGLIILYSIGGLVIFLSINFYITGAFFGENNRSISNFSKIGIGDFILKNLFFSFLNAMNPVFNAIRISAFTFYFSVLISLVTFVTTCYLLLMIFRRKLLDNFKLLLFLISLSVLIGLIYSSFTTGIDGLHIRLSLAIFFCIYFVILISFKKVQKIILPIVILSLLVNLSITYMESFNYLMKRENVKNYLLSKPKKQFYFNDIGKIPTETGGTKTSNFFTIFCLNPNIKVLNDEQLNSSDLTNVVKESELVKIKPINRTEMMNNKAFSK